MNSFMIITAGFAWNNGINPRRRKRGAMMKWFLFIMIVPALCTSFSASAQATSVKLPKPVLKGK